MSGLYIDASTLDECRDALRHGKKLEELADVLRCDPYDLSRLLGLPASQPETEQSEPDLFAGYERLREVL